MSIDPDRALLYVLSNPPAGADVGGPWLSFGPVPEPAIAERLDAAAGVDAGTVRRALSRLADDGLVRRSGPPDDPRWALTDRGAARAERLPDGVVSELGAMEPRDVDADDDCEWRSLVYLG